MKTIKNKIVSFLMIFTLLFGMMPELAITSKAEESNVYISVSYDGKFKKNSSNQEIACIAVPLSTLSNIDLSNYTDFDGDCMSAYNYDSNNDGENEITALHLMIYAHENIYGGSWSNVIVSGAPGSLFFANGLFGLDYNLNYYYNGSYPIDDALTATNGYSTGATADHIVLNAGDCIDIAGFSNDSNSIYSATFSYVTDSENKIVRKQSVVQGESLSLKLNTAVYDWNTGGTTITPANGRTVCYSQTAFDVYASSVTTDSDGAFSITLNTPGTWYLWSNGSNDGSASYAPAYAVVEVSASGTQGSVPENQAPVLNETYSSGSGNAVVYLGEEYKLDLSKMFEDTDQDSLTYTVSVDGNDAQTLSDSEYIYSDTYTEKNTLIVFTASDGTADVSYTLNLKVEKKVAKLESLIIHTSASPNNTNVLLRNSTDNYSNGIIFDADVIEYNLGSTFTDSTTQLRFRAKANGNGTKVILYDNSGNEIKDITWTSGSSVMANFLTGGLNEFQIKVTSDDENVETTTYRFKIGVLPTLSALSSDISYWDKTFSNKTLEYTMTVPAHITSVTMNAIPKAEDYIITYNGQASNVVDITNIDKIEVTVSKDNLSNTYVVNLVKPDVSDVKFTVNPSDATVMVYDHKNTSVSANADGSYTGMFGTYTYTYTVSKNGYISQSGTIPAEGGNLSISLEKVVGEQPEEVDSYWSNFRGSDSNMAITDAPTPRNKDAENIAVKWTKKLGTGWAANPSVQIIVDDSLIVMSGKIIYKMDLETGDILAQGTMTAAPNFGYTPPTYAAGMIFCPLSGGVVQAFDAKTLESLWIYKDSLKGQALSPITYSDGYIYTGFWNGEAKTANFVCISITDENVESKDEIKTATWTHSQQGGFYWAGSVVVGDAVIVGTDDGTSGFTGNSYIYSFNKYTGSVISKHELTGAGDQRSSISYDKNSGRIYFTTKNGYLYRADVDVNTGVLSNLKGVNNHAQSTSTPVVYNGRVYYGTGSGISTSGSSGNLVVADAETLEVMFYVELKGYPQCSMLLSTAYERTTGYIYLYSTYNSMPGGISVIKLKSDCLKAEDAEVTELYNAEGYEQYCICSIICDEDGTLYYKNDSGNIFAIGVPSVENVENLIDLIGTVTIESKGAISAARGAYDTLSLLEKAEVSNYDVLKAAETLFAEYEKADAVDQAITAIGKVTINSESVILAARNAYDALASSEKSKVTKLSVLTAAEETLKELKALNLEEVAAVEKLIDAIGQVTISSETRIKKARNAFNKLTDAQKKAVSNYDDLLDAEDALEKAKIQAVEDKIDSIGTVTLSSKAAINRARTAYNSLSANNKKMVSNLSLLEAAEKEYQELLNESKTTKTATAVNKMTTSPTIGYNSEDAVLNKVTLSAKELLEAVSLDSYNGEIFDAIMAYENLTDTEKYLLNKEYLIEELKQQLSENIHTDHATEISVSGAEWNVQLVVNDVIDLSQIESMKNQIANGQILGLWDISLENLSDGNAHKPSNAVLIKIPVSTLGDFTSYDGVYVVHYTDDNIAEYLNCTLIGDYLVFNAVDFSNFAVVGYHGKSPMQNLMTGNSVETMQNNNNMSWIPWTICGVFGIAFLSVLVILAKKNKSVQVGE